MATTEQNQKTARVITVFFIVVLLVITWLISPLFLPVWRWKERPLETVAENKNIPLEQLTESKFRLMYEPRTKQREDDPTPWYILVDKTEEETPEWELTPDGDRVDEYRTLVRCELINERTGEPPNVGFLGGTQWDKFFDCRGWRLPAGSLDRGHSRPVIIYKGGSLEKLPLAQSKSFTPHMKQEIRNGNWIKDDDPEIGFLFRSDPVGDRILYGPSEEELKAKEEAEAAAAAAAEEDGEGAGEE